MEVYRLRDTILKLENISKSFPGVKALDNVSIELQKNEVLGLVGENGAGKSTLLKILAGIYQADLGEYILNSDKVKINSFIDANKHGIGMVFQEQSLLPNLSIVENLFLGSEKQFLKLGQIDKKNMYKECRRLLAKVDCDIESSIKTENVSFSQRQMVEIAKALRVSENAKNSIILFDEPTSVLQDEEIEKLFAIIKELKKEHSIVFISHRLDEILEVSDRVYILRDGKNVSNKKSTDTNESELHQLMVGRSLQTEYYKVNQQIDTKENDVILKVENLSSPGLFENCSFELRKGQVLGLCGVEGSGKESLCRSLFGLVTKNGQIFIDNSKVNLKTPDKAVEAGIAYIPKERLTEGVIPHLGVMDNINISNLKNLQSYGVINKEQEERIAGNWIKKLRIKTPKMITKCSSLSGGNQQKVVLSKWLSTQGIKILILDHPTRGIDVGAKEELYQLIREIVKNGISIILTSDTLEELIGLSNTIYVMKDGVFKQKYIADPDCKPSQEELVAHMV